ncbi:hypothetical protein RHGRI_027345 [Rhododendron griersonianum]|uniref:Glycosyltransferase N-terminal domain-containing protein n=1 Tax=Rhododendron griersonianum TaxID=479676 RepID=A0AAV6IWB7_9ERIC|nr:hypothetical protein RHGRI_027345 [Rhododendron griersonianum]
MLPWLAQGHITPFLELAKKLSTKDFHIYLCSTPIILTSIQNRITKTQSLSIQLIPLHLLPTSPELPPHHHTTNGLPPHLLPTLINAFDSASPEFSKLVQTLRPDLVIYDFLQPWAPTIASEYNIPAVEFVTTGAAVVSFFSFLAFKKPDVELPFPELQPLLLGSFRNAQPNRPVDDGGGGKQTPMLECMKKSSKMILFNTFRELEGKYLDYLPISIEKKMVPIGPLVHETDHEENKDSAIMQWLGTKDELSTVFVSFGSDSFLSEEEREEIANGLELSGVNFVWVVSVEVKRDENRKLNRENIARVIRKVVKDDSGAQVHAALSEEEKVNVCYGLKRKKHYLFTFLSNGVENTSTENEELAVKAIEEVFKDDGSLNV